MSASGSLPYHSHLVIRWDNAVAPVPRRTITAPPEAAALLATAAPPWIASGAVDRPFDFCGHVGRLLEDIVARCAELRHVAVPRILLAVTQARNSRKHGLQARVTPLRFHDGSLTRKNRGVTYQVQRIFAGEHEYLYLMTFCLPRFLDQDFDDKFITLFHELFHISPKCDGDLRRHDGRYQLHSHSQKSYDGHMADLARDYLAGKPNPEIYAFMRLSFNQLCQRHGGIDAVVVPRPKVYPIAWPGSPAMLQASLST